VPNRYFPRYKVKGSRLGWPEFNPNEYSFRYKVRLAAPKDKQISYCAKPSNAKIVEKRRLVAIGANFDKKPPRKDIRIFYKTSDMTLSPNLFM